MPLGIIVLFGAFAGSTIFLGLPIAFLRRTSSSLKAFMSMLATGILVFLLYDVISKASEPISKALDQVHAHHGASNLFFLDVFLLLLGLALGSVGLVYFNKYVYGRLQPRQQTSIAKASLAASSPQPVSPGVKIQDISAAEAGFDTVRASSRSGKASVVPASREFSPQTLALVIATGIGLHNFSEGLAIGQSATTGALQLAIVLMIGFGLHNMTEGFGIAGPLTGQAISWKFIFLLGLIGGGPTFLGTIVGVLFNSPQVFILFLALAAGAILYVLGELFGVAKRFKVPEISMWGLLLGFSLGYITDLLVTFAGA